jgi:hypothetical protein
MKKRILSSLCAALIVLIALQGCNFVGGGSSDDRLATVEGMETSIAATLTAAASQSAITPELEQPQAPATQEQAIENTPDVQATQMAQASLAAQATAAAASLSGTQAALAPIQSDLAVYGVDPSQGVLGWVQPPLHVEVNQYRGKKFDNKFPMVMAKDFVMSSDVTWNTQYGGSGCAFVFRSNGDQQSPSQYMVVMTRLASGHVFFAVAAQGEMMIVKDFYANGIDPSFNAENGATNRLAVVGNGTTFSIYTNGVKLGDADPNAPLPPLALPSPPVKPFNTSDPVAMAAYKQEMADYKQQVSKLKNEYNQRVALWNKLEKNFPSGFTALGVVADSGLTVCDFNNAWLWLMGAPEQLPMQTIPPGYTGPIPTEYLGTIAALTAQANAQGTPAP